ncbi:MAG: hypothetical protein VSS52_010740, partial [Thiotrichaceae bacterium]|nr:hypothetical protein [Thiotrichaceae bacterium]
MYIKILKIPLFILFSLLSSTLLAGAQLTSDGKLSLSNLDGKWANFEYISNDAGLYILKLQGFGSHDKQVISAQDIIQAGQPLYLPRVGYQSDMGISYWSLTLNYHGAAKDGSLLVNVQSLEKLPSYQTISGTVIGGFTSDNRQTRVGNQQASGITQATLSFHNADGEAIAEYEQATDENGHFSLDVPSQEAVYLKVKGGFLANDTTRPFNSELMVLCIPSEMDECHATAYGSLVMRVAEQQTGDSWNERISQAQDLIHATLQIDRDPALNEIENWQQIFDDARFWSEIGQDAEGFADWRDTLANDILDGYLDTEYLQLTFIGSSIRPNFTLSVFGRGEVRSSDNSMVVDTKVDNASSLYRAYLDADTGLELTATPDTEYEILYWTGCDLVSSDKTRCAAQFRGDEQIIGVTFGRTNPEVVSNVFDVTNATYTVSDDVYDLVASASDTELQQVLANIQVNDYIVSARDSGFLRQVTAVQVFSATEFQFTTIGASLEDVITHGTVAINDDVEVDDLASLTTERAKRSVRNKTEDDAALAYLQQLPLGSDEVVMTSTPGLSLKRSKKPDELVLIFGQPETGRLVRATRGKSEQEFSIKQNFILFDKDKRPETTDDQIRVSGEINTKISLDTGLNISWNQLQSMKLIAGMESTEKLTFEGDFSALLGKQDAEIKLLELQLKPIVLFIGPVPIVLIPKLDVVGKLAGVSLGVKASLEFEFAQYAKAGFVYEGGDNKLIEPISSFNQNIKFNPQLPHVTLNATPGFDINPSVSLYGTLNFSVYFSAGMKFNLSMKDNVDENLNSDKDCPLKLESKLDASLNFGLKAKTEDYIALLDFFKFELDRVLYKKEIKIFDAEKLIGNSDKCVWLSPPKLAVTGKPIQETLDFTTDKSLVLAYDYTVTNIGGRDLDWSVALEREDGDVKFIRPDGSITDEIKAFGLKPNESYTFQVTVNTGNFQPVTPDNLGAKLLSFVTDGASDNLIALVSPIYWNTLQFKNDNAVVNTLDSSDEGKAMESGLKGDTDIPIEIELPVDPLAGAPILNSAIAVSDDSVRLKWGYPDALGLLIGQGYTIYIDDLTTEEDEEIALNYYGMLDRLNPVIDYTVTGLKADTPYDFTIEAFAENTWSGLSNIVEARTLKKGEVSTETPVIVPISAFQGGVSQFPKTFSVNAVDSSGNALDNFTIQITQQPSNATVTVSGTDMLYDLSETVYLGTDTFIDSFAFVVINELGITSEPSTVNVKVLSNDNSIKGTVTPISTGVYHTCALDTGAAKCWGYHGYGQLGNNSTESSRVPVTVVGLETGVEAISAGD